MRNLWLPILLLLGGCVAPDSGAPTSAAALTLPASAHLLTGEEIRTTFAGNTMRSVARNGSIHGEFYANYGAISGVSGGARYSGTWRVEGDKLCTSYPGHPQDSECTGVAVDGDQVYYLDADGKVDPRYSTPDQRITGNPDNL
jgi:hypothetical protein